MKILSKLAESKVGGIVSELNNDASRIADADLTIVDHDYGDDDYGNKADDDKIRSLKKQLLITENNYVMRLQDELSSGVINAARQHRLDIIDSLLRLVDDKRALCAKIESAFGSSVDSLKYCELYNEIGAVNRVFAKFVTYNLFANNDDNYYYLAKLVFYYFYKLARFRATTPRSKLTTLICDHANLLMKYGRCGTLRDVVALVLSIRRLVPGPSPLPKLMTNGLNDVSFNVGDVGDEDFCELVRIIKSNVFSTPSVKQPSSLMIICRNRIRNSMCSMSDHSLELLGLPRSLKSILT